MGEGQRMGLICFRIRKSRRFNSYIHSGTVTRNSDESNRKIVALLKFDRSRLYAYHVCEMTISFSFKSPQYETLQIWGEFVPFSQYYLIT